MAAYPISIPGASSRHDVMSPNSMASPISISSPYSVHSSLSNNSLTGQTLASSFATSVNSSTSTHASALSPQSEDESSGGLNSATLVDKKHKPHECDVCGACFARKVHLQRHSLRHQVCKPYCCERCGKCFSRQDSLVRHHRLLHEKIKEKPKRASSGSTKKKSAKDNNANRSYMQSTPAPSTSSPSSVPYSSSMMERRQSVGQSTSAASSFDEEDEDMMSISEETSTFSSFSPFGGHGPRRNTVSNMETMSHQDEFQCSFPRVFDDSLNPATSHWAAQLHQPHPFEMPHLEPTTNFMDVKSLHPQQLHQHLSISQLPTQFFDSSASSNASPSDHNDIPLLSLLQQGSNDTTMATPSFDWSSLIHGTMGGDLNVTGESSSLLPFNKSASDKSLNATLSRGPEAHDNSCFPSPSIHALNKMFPTVEPPVTSTPGVASSNTNTIITQQLQQSNGTVNLASLGLPVHPNLNINLPADLQMSAENWDNLMRCLTMMATRQADATKSS